MHIYFMLITKILIYFFYLDLFDNTLCILLVKMDLHFLTILYLY